MPNIHTLTLFTSVLFFWLLVILKARSLHRPWFPNLLILPFCFLGIGLWLNRLSPPWGTYVIGGLHVILLGMLALKLSTKGK